MQSGNESDGVTEAAGLIPGQTRGFRAAQWRMLLATMFCYFFYYTGRQTFGFAIPGIQAELNLTKQTLGWCSTALLWSYAVGQAINGNLGDKFGGRRMMASGAWLSCGLNWVVSFGMNFWAIVIPWGFNGLAQSMGWAPGSRVLSNWWGHHERGKAYGFYVFAAGMSSVLSFATSLLIVDTFEMNWRWIFRLPVLLLLVGGTVYYLIVRDRPEELGYPPLSDEGAEGNDGADDGDQSTQNEIETGVCGHCGYSVRGNAGIRCPECGRNVLEVGIVPVDQFHDTSAKRYRDVLTNWRFMVAAIAIGFQSFARYGLMFWVPVHFLGHDWKDSPYAWISLALPVGMALGALSNGWLSDRLFGARRWPAITLFLFLAAITSVSMYGLPRSSVFMIPLLFLTGFFVYGPQSSFWALCPDLLGHRRAGTGTGVMNFVAYLFAGIGEPLIGLAIESNKIEIVQQQGDGLNVSLMVDNTGIVFPIVAASCLIGAVIATFTRR